MPHYDNVFWIKDPRVLYKNSNYLDFVPTFEMSRESQLNALTRFAIYFIILALILGKSSTWVQIPVLFILFLIFLYFVFVSDPNSDRFEADRIRRIDEEALQENERPINLEEEGQPFVIEGGYYDSDNNLIVDRYLGSKTSARRKTKFSLEDYTAYQNSITRLPTIDNPLMNPLLDDISLGPDDGPVSANANDEDIKNRIVESYNDKLYRDIDDLFERENSQRQFYTVPKSYPNDQTSFANWLYKANNICKVDQRHCLKDGDLRYKRINQGF